MAEIYKSIASKKKPPRGFVLIAAVLAMAVIGVLAFYVSSFTVTENKISSTQSNSIKAYYLAESGVADAINKIKNDPVWKNSFETNPAWSQTYTRTDALYPGSSYAISIANTNKAYGVITVTGNYVDGKKTSKRVIKAVIFKAIGGNTPLPGISFYNDGALQISRANLTVLNGGIYSNDNMVFNVGTNISVDGTTTAVGNINGMTVDCTDFVDAHCSPKPEQIFMPSVSFDSPVDSNSLKARAAQVYTPKEFKSLLDNNQNLTLNGIHYVTGDIEITGTHHLTINGALVSDGEIIFGIKNGDDDIVMNIASPSSTTPTGLFAKSNIVFNANSDVNIDKGVIYTNGSFNIWVKALVDFNIVGGILCRGSNIDSPSNIQITLDPSAVGNALSYFEYSSVITVEHWEEEY